MPPSAAQTFAHVGLTCRDPAATERFYSRHFGFTRARVVPLENDKAVVFLKSGNVYLELFSAETERPVPPAEADGPLYPGLRHIAFQVENIERTLAGMGEDARVTLGPLKFDQVIPGWHSVWVSDPDGNIIEISQGYRDEERPPLPPWGSEAVSGQVT